VVFAAHGLLAPGGAPAAIAVDCAIRRVLGFSVTLGAAHRRDGRALRGATGAAGTARWRVRRWIVVPQTCLSLVLLLAASVLVQALLQAELGDRGFKPDHLVYADVALPAPTG
jgi:hypothetical protein